MNNQSPKALWEEDQNTAVLVLRVHQDGNGQIWSVHQFKSEGDEQKTFSWPGGGARQLAFAFLTEALRREAYASVLVELSKNGDYLKNYKNSTKEQQLEVETHLSQVIQAVISNSSLKMGDQIAKEILHMLSSQV